MQILKFTKVGKYFMQFLFQWFDFEFQQLYSQWQESKDSNIKIVSVKEVLSILYSFETTLQWAAPHLNPMHSFLYIRLSKPGAA